MPELSPTEIRTARRRATWTLVASVGLGSTGNIAGLTVATIVAKDLLGNATLAGAPGASIVLGSAVGSVLLSGLMARRGRRLGLVTGYSLGVVGAFLATLAVISRSFPLLMAGTVLIGFGNTSNQLARYTAADLVPAARRASAIGLVVWGATIGSVAGPWLVPISSDLVAGFGLPPLAGPYLVPVVFVGLAAVLGFALLRPDPYAIAHPDHAETHDGTPRLGTAGDNEPDARSGAGAGGGPGGVQGSSPRGPDPTLRATLLRPWVAAAIVALVIGQFTMVLIMTMTPLHMTDHGHDLGAVGMVLSAHTLGMFALSPISGRIAERFGNVPTIFAGTAVLAFASIMAAVAPPTGGTILLVALFLLGYGWNLGFVAGSSLLSSSLEVRERTRVQGAADALIWSAAAAASLGSGVVVAVAGYTALGVLGAGAVVLPVIWLRSAARSAGRPVVSS